MSTISLGINKYNNFIGQRNNMDEHYGLEDSGRLQLDAGRAPYGVPQPRQSVR
jgi:hypothetical protein